MQIAFSKYQATGNDFILLNGLIENINLTSEQIMHMCNRHFGIGADGLIVAKATQAADLFMDLYNADGSTAEMSGNGVRALAAFYLQVIAREAKQSQGFPRRNTTLSDVLVETRAGLKTIKAENKTFSVDMGKPSFTKEDIGFESKQEMWAYPLGVPNTDSHPGAKQRISVPTKIYGASMGNPHCIIFTDNIEKAPVEELGPFIENNHLFKNRINIEWVQVISDEELSIKVWERGVGYTLACGTGACASFAVAYRLGYIKKQAKISLPGGQVQVELADENLFLKGEAQLVFNGSVEIE